MGYKILIVDDDATFNQLLTDIFRQAGHDVESVQDPLSALERTESEELDLLVTDHRMPELTGHELFKRVRKAKPNVPIVIVSGYLSNANIRSLIEEGINGVYIKPLNVFALLKQAEDLISQSKIGELGAHQRTLSDKETKDHTDRLPFPFKAFPCVHQKSEAFARRLFELRNFKSTLVLIGAGGTPFKQICNDLANFDTGQTEYFDYLNANLLNSDTLFSRLKSAKEKDVSRLTFVIRDLEKITNTGRDLIVSLIKGEPPYDVLPSGSRAVFCTSKDVDNLYDEGLIDDRMYVLMGAGELRVPSLRSIPDDIPALARQLLEEIASNLGHSQIPVLGAGSSKLLKSWSWSGNLEELKETLERVIRENPNETLTPDMFQGKNKTSEVAVTEADFIEMLNAQKKQILQGIKTIANHRQDTIEAILNGGISHTDSSGSPMSERQSA
ncbi:MAG: response regulator [Opitutales bacterium]